jgi:hypothetical protein
VPGQQWPGTFILGLFKKTMLQHKPQQLRGVLRVRFLQHMLAVIINCIDAQV